MDGGVIGSLKRRYRSFQVRESLKFIESNTEGTFKIDQLMGMKWVQSIWFNMEPSIICNSWSNTGLISDIHTSTTKSFSNDTTEIELIELKRILCRLVPIQLHSKIDEYL